MGIPALMSLLVVAAFSLWLGAFLANRKQHVRASSARSPDGMDSEFVAKAVDGLASSVQSFREKLTRQCEAVDYVTDFIKNAAHQEGNTEWTRLVQEILLPAQKLSLELTAAYDRLRSKTDEVQSIHGRRTDSVTGLSNEYAMHEWLRMMFALMSRYQHGFSLAIVDMNKARTDFAVSEKSFHALSRAAAELLAQAIRETDYLFRLNNGQFVVALPETDLAGAVVVSNRVQHRFDQCLSLDAGIGVVQARDDDDQRSLIERAQAAVFAAHSDGGNAVFRHTGRAIESAGRNEKSASEVRDEPALV